MTGKSYDATRLSLRALLAIVFLDQTTLTITFPLLTLIFFDSHSRLFSAETSDAVRSMWYGLCVALPNTINIFFAPLLSSLSDEFGRKKILLLEIASASVFTMLVTMGIYSGMLYLVFFGFIIKGAFSRINPTALAIIGETAPRETKIYYMSDLQFAISLGALVGPLLGGYLAQQFFPLFNFAFPFLVAASIALGNTFFATIWISETRINPASGQFNHFNFKTIKSVWMDSAVLRISIILLLVQFSWSLYYQFIPPLLKLRFDYNAKQLGIFIGIIAFWLAVSSAGLRFLLRFLSLHQVLKVSMMLVVAGLSVALLASRHYLPYESAFLWLSAIPIAGGDVMTYSCLTALYSNVVSAEQQGKVMAVALLVVSFIWAFTGLLGGILLTISPDMPLFVAPCGALIALFFMHRPWGRKLVLDYGV